MTAQILLAITAVAAAAVTAFGAYWTVRRGSSGKIKTTNAESLWLEAETLRTAYRDEADRLRQEMTALRLATQQETRLLRNEVSELREEIRRLKEGVHG